MQFWTPLIRRVRAFGRRFPLLGMRKAGLIRGSQAISSDRYADLEARIDFAREDLQQLDHQLSEIALILIESIDDPRTTRARERWKELTSLLSALTSTADELLQ